MSNPQATKNVKKIQKRTLYKLNWQDIKAHLANISKKKKSFYEFFKKMFILLRKFLYTS